MKNPMLVTIICALLLLTSVVVAQDRTHTTEHNAQDRTHTIEHNVVTVQSGVPGDVGIVTTFGGQGDNFVFVSSEMSLDGKTVKGAPYSAQAVTETVQTLADGNRIVRRNTA